jgi:hypothetical protein
MYEVLKQTMPSQTKARTAKLSWVDESRNRACCSDISSDSRPVWSTLVPLECWTIYRRVVEVQSALQMAPNLKQWLLMYQVNCCIWASPCGEHIMDVVPGMDGVQTLWNKTGSLAGSTHLQITKFGRQHTLANNKVWQAAHTCK